GAALGDDRVAQRAAHVLPQAARLGCGEGLDLQRGPAEDEVRPGDRAAALIDLHPQLHAVDRGDLQPAEIDAVLLRRLGDVVRAVLEVVAARGRRGPVLLRCGLLARLHPGVSVRPVGGARPVGSVRPVGLPATALLGAVAPARRLGVAGLLAPAALPAGELPPVHPSVVSSAAVGARPAPNPPLEPKPAPARTVSSRSSASSSRGARNGTTTSWATRSPTCRAKDSERSVLCSATLTGPR